MIENGNLHSYILKYIIEKGYAPDESVIAEEFKCTIEIAKNSLIALQEYHGVVLHPNDTKIWVIHPFSTAPTLFTVKSAHGMWWGNCAWCSLGVCALVKEDATITTNIGGHDQQVVVSINNGEIDRKDLYVHFPIKMTKAWDNVIYTCSNMLLFRNEDEVNNWSLKHNIPRGDIQPIEKIWEFSKVWYGNHLNSEWKKWTINEAIEIFNRFGLINEIWEMEVSEKIF